MIEATGRLVPLVTPFTDDQSTVSEVRLARAMMRLRNSGVEGYVVCSDAGEFTTLSISERKHVLELVMRENQTGLPVLVNVSAISSNIALDLAQHAKRHGARGIIAIPPYYGQFTQAEIAVHFRFIANHGGLPLLRFVLENQYGMIDHELLKDHTGIRTVDPAFEDAIWENPSLDEFSFGEITCTPMGLLAMFGEVIAEEKESFKNAFQTYGTARVIKALGDLMDFEQGPPRTPVQPIPHELAVMLASKFSKIAA